MDDHFFYKARICFTMVVLVGIWSLLAWSFLHGGVPSHHILANKDLPSFSNWWGGLLLPLTTWLLLFRVHKRTMRQQQQQVNLVRYQRQIVYGFAGALVFGILLSVFFTLAYTDLAGYLMLSLLPLALLVPIYREECLLGFVLGMTYTFGGVLPLGIGALLLTISAGLYLLVRPGLVYVASSARRVTSTK